MIISHTWNIDGSIYIYIYIYIYTIEQYRTIEHGTLEHQNIEY